MWLSQFNQDSNPSPSLRGVLGLKVSHRPPAHKYRRGTSIIQHREDAERADARIVGRTGGKATAKNKRMRKWKYSPFPDQNEDANLSDLFLLRLISSLHLFINTSIWIQF